MHSALGYQNTGEAQRAALEPPQIRKRLRI